MFICLTSVTVLIILGSLRYLFSYIYGCYHLSILWLIFVNVFVGSLPQVFNAWVDYLLYSYDLSLKAFSVGLLNLFRLKSSRNKRSEPYYYPLLWRALRGGRLTIQSREIPHGIYIRSLGKSLSSETRGNNLFIFI